MKVLQRRPLSTTVLEGRSSRTLLRLYERPLQMSLRFSEDFFRFETNRPPIWLQGGPASDNERHIRHERPRTGGNVT
jgi:hypothetical protein